ncbi:MAG: PAS domain S-box protein [Planctomycetaceae bacterium]|nr:PAS domain S-box protein [Planctomycetaceae bacterium]
MPIQLLLIEDDPSDAWFLRRMLESQYAGQYAITTATTLREALAAIGQRPFDAAVVDLSLPDSQGLETIERLVETTPGLPIVVLSGLADEKIAMEAMRLGAEDYLLKGRIDAQTVGRAIRYAMNRKLAAEALRESEERLRLAIDAIGGGNYTFDFASKEAHFSPELKVLFGLRPDEALLWDADKLPVAIHPEDRQNFVAVREAGNNPLGTGLFRLEFRIFHTDGGIRWLQVNGRTEFTGESGERRPRRTAGVVIDITDKKRAESALLKSEARYRAVVETAREGIAIVDPQENIVFVNQAFADMLGCEREEMAGLNLQSFAAKNEFARYEDDTAVRRQRRPSQYKTTLRHKSGEPRRLSVSSNPLTDEHGSFIGSIGLVTDITDRERAEAALRASEAKYRQLHETMRDAFVGVALDGRIVECNKTYADMLGYTREELCALTYMDFTPEKWHSMQADIIKSQVVPRGYSDIFEKEYRRKDGTVFPVELRLVLLRDDAGQPQKTWGIVRDITDRKLAEESLRQSEDRYHSLFNMMIEGFAVHDILYDDDGRPCDYRFVDVNPAFEQLTALKRADIIGKRVREVMPATEFYWIEDYGRVAASGEPLHKESYSSSLGRWYEVLAYRTSPGRFAVIFSDVTERRRSQEALRESEERLRSVIEASPDAIAVVNLDGTILMASQEAARLFGFDSVEQAVSTNTCAFDLVIAEERGRVRENVAKLIELGVLRDIEYCGCRRDGSQFPIEISGSLQRDAHGSPKAIIIVLRDITERKRAQQLLEDASRAKSEFLANMSHEIRTPMTAILGFTDLLAAPGSSLGEQCECIAGIRKNGESLLSLIGDILDLSKIEAEKLTIATKSCPLQRIIDDVVSVIRVETDKKKLSLKTDYQFPLPETIHTDELRLRQILLNLAGNAVKFTSQGGIRISVSCERKAGNRAQVRFAVSDTGIGISADKLGGLFQPFTQIDGSASRRYGGTGLGLAISKRLAEALGGDIEVTSELGKGSTFTATIDPGSLDNVRMLQSQEPIRPLTRTPSQRTSLPALSGRLLLAEDDPSIQRIVSLLLGKMGLEVTVAETGRIACEKADLSKTAGRPYDLILMDMQMPQMDGYEATRWLRRHDWQGPIVALTAHAMVGDREKCLAAGCNDYIPKPMIITELRGLLAPYLSVTRSA